LGKDHVKRWVISVFQRIKISRTVDVCRKALSSLRSGDGKIPKISCLVAGMTILAVEAEHS